MAVANEISSKETLTFRNQNVVYEIVYLERIVNVEVVAPFANAMKVSGILLRSVDGFHQFFTSFLIHEIVLSVNSISLSYKGYLLFVLGVSRFLT